jgi:hypothetical protein
MKPMQQRIYPFRRISSPEGVTWLGKLGLFAAAVIGIALIGALAVLSLVIAVVLIPVVAVALLLFRWRLGRMQKQAAAARGAAGGRRPAVIETEYVVIDRDPGR